MTQAKLRTCFISSPITVDTSPLREELETRGVRWHDVATSPMLGSTTLDLVRSGIAQADFVCGVVSEQPVGANVFFELGLAVGSNRPTLVFIDPRVDVPTDLDGLAYARATLQDTEALRFHLDLFLDHAKPRALPSGSNGHRQEQTPSPEAQQWLDRAWLALASTSAPPRESEIIRFLTELFPRFGIVASAGVASSVASRKADLAVWIDDLGPIMGNPLLIEVVGQHERVAAGETQFRNVLGEWGTNFGLLVYWGEPHLLEKPSTGSFPIVISFSLSEVVERLRNGSFVSSLRNYRNRAVHALATP